MMPGFRTLKKVIGEKSLCYFLEIGTNRMKHQIWGQSSGGWRSWVMIRESRMLLCQMCIMPILEFKVLFFSCDLYFVFSAYFASVVLKQCFLTFLVCNPLENWGKLWTFSHCSFAFNFKRLTGSIDYNLGPRFQYLLLYSHCS